MYYVVVNTTTQDPGPNGWLLASDLDGTLISTTSHPEADEAVSRLTRLLGSGGAHTAYVTGRHLELALDGIEGARLPVPHAIASDVGTTLHRQRDGRFEPDVEYERHVASGDAVPEGREVRAALGGVSGLRLQEEEKQARFKVSFYFDGPFSPEVLSMIDRRLSGVGRARLVHSRDPVTGVGLLDVLPEAVGKETAVRFLAERWGHDPDSVVFAGDSGNDRAALLSGVQAILVGNAPAALVAEIREAAHAGGLDDRVFVASKPFAAGVWEGLEHFGRERS